MTVEDSWPALPALGAVAVASIACAVALGPRGEMSLWPRDDIERRIVVEVRLPRVVLGFMAGVALATAGMAFQALFRNALATPYTVGVSAGASLGSALYVYSGWASSSIAISGSSLAAFAGALASIALVYGLARSARDFSTATLLLGGVTVSFLCTSLILLVQYVGDVTTSFRVGRWLLGGLEVVGFAPVLQLLPFVIPGVLVLCAVSRKLDLLAVGEDWAAMRGLPIRLFKQLVFAASSFMVAGVVATCGPIGFVGLIVPHIGRIVVGPAHRRLAPFCVLGGGTFLVLCDAVGRTVVAPVELPVGIVTALVGAPFFLGLLMRGHARGRIRG
jgi:iron complex transport system permease protein